MFTAGDGMNQTIGSPGLTGWSCPSKDRESLADILKSTKKEVDMNIKKALTVVITLFLALLISNPINAFYLSDHIESHVSRYLDVFFIQVEESYLDDKMIQDLGIC